MERNDTLFGLKLILAIIVLFFFIAGFAVVLLSCYHESDTTGYYVTKEVSLEGTVMTDREAEKELGVEKISHTMNLYLKDTGDCGVYLINQYKPASWDENEEGDIEISYGKQRVTLSNNIKGLELSGDYQGKKIVIILEKTEKVPESFQQHPELTFGVKYSNRDTRAVCNFMLDGQFLLKGDKIYGKSFSKDECIFGYGTISDTSDGITIGDFKAFEKGGQAKFLNMDEEYIYYLWAPSDGSTESIRRINVETGKSKIIREGNVDYLQLRYDKLYFCDENYMFHEMNKDGSDDAIIVEKEIYVPYVIDKNWLVYQDDREGERLHLKKIGSDYDRTLSSERTYAWTIVDKILFYASTGDKVDENRHRCRLHKLELDSLKHTGNTNNLETEKSQKYMGDSFAIDGNLIYGGDGSYEQLDSWENYSNELFKKSGQREYLVFVDGKYIILEKMTGNGAHIEFVLKSIKNDREVIF